MNYHNHQREGSYNHSPRVINNLIENIANNTGDKAQNWYKN